MCLFLITLSSTLFLHFVRQHFLSLHDVTFVICTVFILSDLFLRECIGMGNQLLKYLILCGALFLGKIKI